MTPDEFIAKWQGVTLKERSAAQEHFIDLCRLLGEPTPAEVDPTGTLFCFEKRCGSRASRRRRECSPWICCTVWPTPDALRFRRRSSKSMPSLSGHGAMFNRVSNPVVANSGHSF